MEDTGVPTLEVGFEIGMGDSFSALRSLDDLIGKTAADAVRQFQQVENASKGAVNLGGATAQLSAFGAAATRELANVAKAERQAEKSAEDMTRQINRQIEVFGKSTSEIRQMRVEMKALAAEKLGMTAAAAKGRAAGAQMDALEASTGRMTVATGKSNFALRQTALQLPDIVGGLLTGQKPMQVFIQQGGQIAQVGMMAEGGLKGFAGQLGGLALRFAPVLAAAGLAAAGLAVFVHSVNEGVTNDQLTRDLGKITGGANATKEELYKLREATVTWGDVSKALFSEVGRDIETYFVGNMKHMSGSVKAVLDDLASYGKATLAAMYAGLAGTKAYLGEVGTWKGLGNLVTGDPALLDRTYGDAYRKADKYLSDLGARVKKQSVENARARLAESIGYNNIPKGPKPRADHHAEELARAAAATEAEIRNLYKLADAYGVSGAAALIAEAQVKAETAAIKQRGDVEAAVDRQVRLSIAQRVSDGEKSAASMRAQASAQAEVNAMVANGLIPAGRAADVLRDRIELLPLLDAAEAAHQREAEARASGDVKRQLEMAAAADRAEKAVKHVQDAQASRQASGFGNAATQDHAAAERQLDQLREEARLIGATDAARVHALATLKATQEAAKYDPGAYRDQYIKDQVAIADQAQANTEAQNAYNDSLNFTADKWDLIAGKVQAAGQGMADAFGSAGKAIGDLASIYAGFQADRARLDQQHAQRVHELAGQEAALARENVKFAIQASGAQIGAYGDMASAAKGFFKEGSAGYEALAAAEKVYRVAQLAMSLQAMIQNTLETTSHVANATAQATADGAAGVAKQSQLPFPANIAAMAATAAALVAAGVAVFGGHGGGHSAPVTNTGTGTVLGDPTAKSESVKNAIEALKEVDLLTNTYSREMAASLKSIDSQIGGVASLVTRAGDVNADATVTQGFKANAIGSVLGAIPVVGGILKSLFGSTTTVTGNGLYSGAQSVGSILGSGFDAQYYSDVQKKSKLFGITTGTKNSTKYSAADTGLTDQFTLILKQFDDAILAAAGPLGAATGDIQNQLNGFVVSLGKIDLKGLTGTEIQEKLTAVFGAAADGMANAAFPGIERFQKVGEGAFETLVRVASTVEAVTTSLDQLGLSARSLGTDAKMGLAAQFDSIGDLTSAVDGYFQAFYTPAEQSAAKAAQLGKVFDSLGVAMPGTLAGFRALVEAQDLTSAAGQATYATLLQLAPAFADLKSAMEGAKSAADVVSERDDLQRQLLELQGNTAAIRALDLAKLDASNRALQEQVWAVQDAQTAAEAANQLKEAWTSVGDSIMDEVKRIRGLTDPTGDGSFASLMGQFNQATAAARAGDQDMAKNLPGLSQALLTAAGNAATSRQELDRVQAQVAASLEATYRAINAASGGGVIPASPAAAGSLTSGLTTASPATASIDTLMAAATAAQASSAPTAANDDTAAEIRALRGELAAMRSENTAGLAAVAGNTGRAARTLENVTQQNGGDAISVANGAR